MTLCTDEEIAELAEALEADSRGDLAEIDTLLQRYPEDPRLHFMKGSVHIGAGQHVKAHKALSRAVELQPEFHIARYQLGFFELTSGEADAALSTWGPLLRLPEDNYLRHFVEGLTHLIRDEFNPAIERMRSGIALNQENAPLNGDIQLLMEQTERLARGNITSGDDAAETADQSATSILLGQFALDTTKH